jgi:uncharacterized lipoprotein YmbA
MQQSNLFFGLLIAILVGACGSTPRSNYYMLSADATGAAGSGGPAIGVGPVTVPEYLKHREIVLNRDAHKIDLESYERWAEPLDAGILRVIALNLSRLLATQEVQTYPWARAATPDFSITVDIAELTMRAGRASLVAKWSVSGTQPGAEVIQRISELSTSGQTTGSAAAAAAYSELLLRLSEEIAAAISAQ